MRTVGDVGKTPSDACSESLPVNVCCLFVRHLCIAEDVRDCLDIEPHLEIDDLGMAYSPHVGLPALVLTTSLFGDCRTFSTYLGVAKHTHGRFNVEECNLSRSVDFLEEHSFNACEIHDVHVEPG